MNPATQTTVIPPNVEKALRNVLEPGESSTQTFQTALKPSFTTPTLWFSVTPARLILFSTLRGGKVFRQARFQEIDSVSLEAGTLKILFRDCTVPDIAFQAADGVPQEVVNGCLVEIKGKIGRE